MDKIPLSELPAQSEGDSNRDKSRAQKFSELIQRSIGVKTDFYKSSKYLLWTVSHTEAARMPNFTAIIEDAGGIVERTDEYMLVKVPRSYRLGFRWVDLVPVLLGLFMVGQVLNLLVMAVRLVMIE